jgi:DNA-binding ferritin-like protein (Dps family)
MAETQGITKGRRTALIQVLGAVAYGELKAYEGAKARAAETSDEAERKVWRTIAAEELRHHKGFVRHLEALGADPERAMRPYRASLDDFHAQPPEEDPVVAAVCSLLGEGIAADMLLWLREVVDDDAARFIDTVLEDEVGHEGRAAAELRALIEREPNGKQRAARGARRMLAKMLTASPGSGPRFTAFLRAGKGHVLVANLVRGYLRRLDMIGIGPLAALKRADVLHLIDRLDPLGTRRGRAEAA